VHGFAAYLFSQGITGGDVVAIFAESSSDWAAADWAITSLGAISVPIFPTLVPQTVAYILEDSGAKLCIVGDARLEKKFDDAVVLLKKSVPKVLIKEAVCEDASAHYSEGMWRDSCAERKPGDLAAIIYTSGTTGEPKGAMLSHEAFVFQCKTIRANLPVDSTDRFLSFLPLSHVYERMGGHYFPISCGADIAYAESLKTLANDIVLARPTIMTIVPRFLEGVRTKIVSGAESAPAVKRILFNSAVKRGPRRLRNNLKYSGILGRFLDEVVGEKVRARFGGRIRFFVSGGAALPLDLAEFYAAFGLKIIQGYGLTETAPVISLNHPDRNHADSVGEILHGIEVKIADDGEILMRGPTRMSGYHGKPAETKEAIDGAGWFHTGDIGHAKGNRLWITDRKKDIIVMSNGKNVAPAMIENKLKSSRYVDEAMVIGDDMDHIAALIVPAFDILKRFCQSKGIGESHNAEMLGHPEVAQLLKKEIETANSTLADFEKVKGYRILSVPWTQETGELTPSLKVRRKIVKEKFREKIAELTK
jgi:long-chain acyl-CoA synthetase